MSYTSAGCDLVSAHGALRGMIRQAPPEDEFSVFTHLFETVFY